MSILHVKIALKRQLNGKVLTNLLRINGDVSEHFRLQLVEGHV